MKDFLNFIIKSFYNLLEILSKKVTLPKSLENQFIYPNPRGSKLIFFAPLGAGVKEENQLG